MMEGAVYFVTAPLNIAIFQDELPKPFYVDIFRLIGVVPLLDWRESRTQR